MGIVMFDADLAKAGTTTARRAQFSPILIMLSYTRTSCTIRPAL